MAGEMQAFSKSEINTRLLDISKLSDITRALLQKIDIMEPEDFGTPEFVKGSLISIYDSQAVLAHVLVQALVILRDGIADDDGSEDPHESGPPRKPILRLVDPDKDV